LRTRLHFVVRHFNGFSSDQQLPGEGTETSLADCRCWLFVASSRAKQQVAGARLRLPALQTIGANFVATGCKRDANDGSTQSTLRHAKLQLAKLPLGHQIEN
jgi:hypothetical protein